MNDEIERLLARVPLRRPSESLDRRILGSGRRPAVCCIAAGAAVAAAAAVIVVALTWPGVPPEGPGRSGSAATHPALAEFPPGPVRLERDFWQLQYEGLFLLDDQTPVRAFRRRILRNVIWIDEQNGFTDAMATPDEEVILVPVEIY